MATATNKIERRFAPGVMAVERREDGSVRLRGHAAVWHKRSEAGSQYDMGWNILERIAKGAFSRVIADAQDVRGLFNHDANMILGRTSAGTLTLKEDARGLLYEIDLPDTTVARDLAASIERGDITGSSFSFRVGVEEWKHEKDCDIRTIQEIESLYDVGPVTFPAYTATDTGLRAAGNVDEVLEARDRWRRQQRNRRILLSRETPID